MDDMKRALVFYSYSSRNAGDMAICVGAIDLLRYSGFDEVVFVSRFGRGDREYRDSAEYLRERYEPVKVLPGPFSLDRDANWCVRVREHLQGFATLFSRSSKKDITDLIKDADLVFFNGGNLLRCQSVTDALRLTALFYPMRLAKKLGKHTVCLPQSTAHSTKIGKVFLRSRLKTCDVIYSRESNSQRALSESFPSMDVRPSTDLAFFIDGKGKHHPLATIDRLGRSSSNVGPDERSNLEKISGRIALVIRGSGIGDIGSLDEDRIASLLEGLRNLILTRAEFRYAIVIQTSKDVAISERLFNELDPRIDIEWIEEHDPVALVRLYSSTRALITMRLHAGILASVAGTPSIGLFDQSWGLKNSGIMDDYQIPYSTDPATLLEQFDRALQSFDSDRTSEIIARFRVRLKDELSLASGVALTRPQN